MTNPSQGETPGDVEPAVKRFPLVEVYGYSPDAASPEALAAQSGRTCRFTGSLCEKYRQYQFAYCSVSYAAVADHGTPRTYAVCDHRLDGEPIAHVVRDHFGAGRMVTVVPEVVLSKPRQSFDYVAFTTDEDGRIDDVVAIETQAVDIRGGGVGPAWEAFQDGRMSEWQSYFARAAAAKKLKRPVAYGVNLGNIYKRLGLQIVSKGQYLGALGIPLYVVMQNVSFDYLAMRVPSNISPRAERLTLSLSNTQVASQQRQEQSKWSTIRRFGRLYATMFRR